MSILHGVSFDTTGLTPVSSEPDDRAWTTPGGLIVRLMSRNYTPEFPATKAGEAAVFNTQRQRLGESDVGLVELSFVQIAGCQAVRTISKVAMDPATGRGRKITGALEVAVERSCVIVVARAVEGGVTGFRESAVTAIRFQSGEFQLTEDALTGERRMLGAADEVGWIVDPKDPAPPHLALNVSDDQKYDAMFPEHPLSIVRAFLDRTQRSMRIDSAGASDRSWWKLC